MSALADAQYADAYETFAKAGDWKRYLADMDTLLQRYPGVWRDRPIVERVATSVRKQVALTEPPAITGDGLTAEDKKLTDDLARDKKPLRQVRQLGYMGATWLLRPEQVLRGVMGSRFGLQPAGTNAPTPPTPRRWRAFSSERCRPSRCSWRCSKMITSCACNPTAATRRASVRTRKTRR